MPRLLANPLQKLAATPIPLVADTPPPKRLSKSKKLLILSVLILATTASFQYWFSYTNLVDDRSEGLRWTPTDNGADLNWSAAERYCRNLNLPLYGYDWLSIHRWRLPTYYELIGLRDSERQSRIRSYIRVTGDYLWSQSKLESGEIWAVSFSKQRSQGGAVTDRFDGRDQTGKRVLCVKRLGM